MTPPRLPSLLTSLTAAALLAASAAAPASLATPHAGPPGTVTITRDANGTPHVYARRPFDLFRGCGDREAESATILR